jgi:hypothetical protein
MLPETMKIYVQTEYGAAVLGEIPRTGSVPEILAAIEYCKPLAMDVLAPGDMHTFGCGTHVPDNDNFIDRFGAIACLGNCSDRRPRFKMGGGSAKP